MFFVVINFAKITLKPQALSHLIPDLLLVFGSSLTPHLGRLDIGGALIIGLSKHAHDGDENLLDTLDRRPALRGVFVVVRVVAGWVQDGDADCAVGID